ncbi:hypothetical protein [Muricoccus radiodurans]|uniref:hypothetical protein n=1 Tax=Muricoccus radiodurans TaxID=2231721 RepID=UPI003CF24F7C
MQVFMLLHERGQGVPYLEGLLGEKHRLMEDKAGAAIDEAEEASWVNFGIAS